LDALCRQSLDFGIGDEHAPAEPDHLHFVGFDQSNEVTVR
jgi:hypothetical protein